MLSAVALATARKDSYERACASDRSIKRLTNKELDNLKIKDIIEEYYEKESEIIEKPDGGIQIIIKEDTVKEPSLKKLSFLQCGIDDFIKDHTLDNIISKVEKENEERGTVNREVVNTIRDTSFIPDGYYTLPVITGENNSIIDNIVNILYTPPESESTIKDQIEQEKEVITIDEIINSFGVNGTSFDYQLQNDNNQSLRCKSTKDVLDILEGIRKGL